MENAIAVNNQSANNVVSTAATEVAIPSIDIRGMNANVLTEDTSTFDEVFEVEGEEKPAQAPQPTQAEQEKAVRVQAILDKVKLEKSKANTGLVQYERKLSLEAATSDTTAIIPKERKEYVVAFKAGVEKTARSTLEMCRVVYEAEQSLDKFQFKTFCEEVGLKDYSSTVRKFSAIGRVYPRFIQYVDQLPASWTNIYLITQIPADAFEECLSKGYALNKLTGAKLDELVKSTKDINKIEDPLSFDSKNSGYVFAKLLFTKKPDDTDWRAMEKALAEISARLPIKFVINKEAAEFVKARRDQRYEQIKQKSKGIDLKPDLWDLGAEANAAYKVAERTVNPAQGTVITV
ncbi:MULTISPECIES: hypothetical protein [Polynucleobacter]|jgi:hypothetical protein|uniref:hypothetical protein n=1 Tax=Polynucleobacter TaxID=44013 RepID=UPI0008F891D3|nr:MULTISPECIES: hypothetical protein [Polynucleobacter]QWD82852.1 hypothetical protein ICU98_05175 [Polynucleobacter sp. MWH-P3-07-1]